MPRDQQCATAAASLGSTASVGGRRGMGRREGWRGWARRARSVTVVTQQRSSPTPQAGECQRRARGLARAQRVVTFPRLGELVLVASLFALRSVARLSHSVGIHAACAVSATILRA